MARKLIRSFITGEMQQKCSSSENKVSDSVWASKSGRQIATDDTCVSVHVNTQFYSPIKTLGITYVHGSMSAKRRVQLLKHKLSLTLALVSARSGRELCL